MRHTKPVVAALVALAAIFAVVASARTQHPSISRLSEDFWFESLSASSVLEAGSGPNPTGKDEPFGNRVPEVFRNGAWSPHRPTGRNAYVAALLSKDVYFKHVIDPRVVPAARHNFTLFARAFCRAVISLGADDCEVVSGAEALVWAVLRAGPSVLLVVRGSNSPQNWITDVTSFRMRQVEDFGGGDRGTRVALGFYKVFSANRRVMVEHVHAAMGKAKAAAYAAAAETEAKTPDGDARAGGGGIGAVGPVADDAGDGGRPRARLWVFGHSLGGAVALMAAAYLDVNKGLQATGVYTFGCPRVGDEGWAAAYRLRDVTLRLQNSGDIVPTLPFGAIWRHVGASATIQACKSKQLPPASESSTASAMAEAAAAALRRYAAAEEAEATRLSAGPEVRRQRFRHLRGEAPGDGDGGADDGAAAAAADVDAAAAALAFPFPEVFRDHWIQTYVRVMWSCLPDGDQDLVPRPEDVYDDGGV